MSNLFFGRTAGPTQVDKSANDASAERDLVRALLEVQSTTTAAIFAALVTKGVLSADEAVEHLNALSRALRADVEKPIGSAAADMLRKYATVLEAAVGQVLDPL